MSEMSHEEAVQALQEAAAIDPDFGGTPTPPEQAPPAQPVATPEGEKPQTEEQPPPVAEGNSEEQFFNPDALDPSLVPAWKQLQAAYTKKTQEIAAQRKQLAEFGDPEVVQDAVELYRKISDPANWGQVINELSEAMQELGLSREQADALAQEEVQRQAESGSPLDGLNVDDPDLEPLAKALNEQRALTSRLQQQLEAVTTGLSAQAEAEALEREQRQRQMEFQMALQKIQTANPHYDQDDLRSIVERAPFYDDDLDQAQAAFEADFARRMERYLASKQAALTPSIQPPAGAGASSTVDNTPKTLAEAAAEAEELLRQLQAAGELDI